MTARQRPWAPHLVCVALLLLECGIWAVLHRSEAELETAARAGTTQERIAALHVLTNRGEPQPGRFDQDFVSSLLASEDPLMRDFAFTTDVAKHADPRAQYRALKELAARPSEAEFWIGFVLHRRKIGVVTGGSSGRLKLQELEWYLDARTGRPLPGDEVLRYIQAHP